MKYCQECGTKLKEINKHHETEKRGKTVIRTKRNFLKAAGILTIIAASLCFLVGIIGLVAYTNGSYYPYPYGSYGYTTPAPHYVLTAAFGIFAFILGLVSGILILLRKLYSLTLFGIVGMMGTAILLVIIQWWFFVLIGIPILVLTTLSMIFTGVSKSEFVS